MEYLFLKDVTVEGVAYKAGDYALCEEIPAGSVGCLTRLGFVELHHKIEPVKAEAVPARPTKSKGA